MDEKRIITRFAPSPTGYLHVGGARTALFSWLLARHAGGQFLLRIEDTDLARSTEQATLQLLDDLRWLGLHWDNPEPMKQSLRKSTYNAIIDQLIERGQAYKAFETAEELDAARKHAEKQKQTYIYRRPNLSDEQIRSYESQGRPSVVRFATPVRDYAFKDVVLGKTVTLPAGQVQDFIIRKTDGMPTYHFAVVVDDAEMGITHVLRGQEHLLNTINHIALQEALSYAQPVYGHLSVIQNLDGSKMGKRDRDKMIRQRSQIWMKTYKKTDQDLADASGLSSGELGAWLGDSKRQLDLPEQVSVMQAINLREEELPEILVHDFRKKGYLPEALLNFLSLLGWSPGGDRELMSMDELVQLFTIDGIGKSSAKFDRAKLAAFNTEISAAAKPERLVAAMRSYLEVHPESLLNKATDEEITSLIEMKRGFRTLRELDEATRFFFIAEDKIQYDPAAIEKVLVKNDGFGVLREARAALGESADWLAADIEKKLESYCQQKQLALGKVAQPIRVAISGGTVSPPIFQSLAFLGRSRSLSRMDQCLALANTSI